MSFWNKVSRAVFKRQRPVGYDLAGNAYYEIQHPYGPKRIVEYASKDAEYRGGTKQLPVQWSAWMSFTRPTPPSMEELQRDAERQTRLGPMIAAIEAREREERILQGYLLPDGTEVPRADQPETFKIPSTLSQPGLSVPGPTAVPPHQIDGDGNAEYLAPPRAKVDPTESNSADELRKLAEEDTKRRLRESGVAEGSAAVDGVQGVGRAFKPARRGA